jgi:hypothetical protein
MVEGDTEKRLITGSPDRTGPVISTLAVFALFCRSDWLSPAGWLLHAVIIAEIISRTDITRNQVGPPFFSADKNRYLPGIKRGNTLHYEKCTGQ